MSYDYLNYRRRQYDLPQPAHPFRPRRATCWDPPGSRDPPGVPPYDQLPPRYRREPYGPPQPHRMGSVQTHRPTCWDPPRQRTGNCYPPPYRDPDMVPDSFVEPRNSYARYRPWQPQYHPRPATKAEDPIGCPSDEGHNDDSIGNKLDRVMDRFDKLDAWREETDRRFENLEPAIPREFSQPLDCDDSGELEYEDYRCKRNWDSNHHMGSVQTRRPTCWDPPGNRPLPSFQPYDPPQSRRPSCWEPSLMATPVVDQKPPLQHVLDQQSPPSHRRAAAPPAPAAAPPPLLHVDQQPSPSCCNPTTHLRQAGACLELPTTVQQPLLQRPPPLPLPRSDHPPQPSPTPPLELLPYSAPRPSPPLHPLSATVPLLVSNGHSQAVPSSRKKEWQTNLHNADEYGLLKVVPCLLDVVVEEGIVEDKLKENGIGSKGLIGSTDDEASDIFKMIKMTIVRAFDPGICVNFSKHRREFLVMQMEKMDLDDSKKELPHEGVIKCLFATETFRIELHVPAKHVVFTTVGKLNWDDEGRH